MSDASGKAARIVFRREGRVPFTAYLVAAALVAVTTLLCEQIRPYLSPINMVMAYLLAVVLAAAKLGLRPAILTAGLGVVAFDYFFVPPRFSLRISDTEYLVTFLALFIVGVVVSSLVARVREGLEELRLREQQTATLYHLSRDLAAAPDQSTVLAAAVKNLEESLETEVALFLPAEGVLEMAAASRGLSLSPADHDTALWSFRSRRMAGPGTDSYADSPLTFIPLKALTEILGVLVIRLETRQPHDAEARRLLDACATQVSLALERVRLAREAQQAQIHKARASLERALLNSISHDLRTPLATITGSLGVLLDEEERVTEATRHELLASASEEAARLNRFVGNLLDLTRLEAGALRLRKEPCDVQDLVGCALSAVEKQLGERRIVVELSPDVPLIALDLVLMIQVLVNVIDNAVKYAPPDTAIEIVAAIENDQLVLEVADRGPGVPEKELGRIFDKFYRIPVPEGVSGTGLGLSISKGIVEAHGGEIRAENRAGGGLRVIVTLPIPKDRAGGVNDAE